VSATLYSNSPTHGEPSGQGYIGHRSMKTVNGRSVNSRKLMSSKRLGRNNRVSDTPGSTGGSVGGVGNGAGSY